MRLLFAAIAIVCFAVLSSATVAQEQSTAKPIGANRVVNGGFEEGPWSFEAVNGCQATGGANREQAHSGAQSFKLTNKSAYGPNIYGRAFQTLVGLEPFTTYRLSCYVKGKNVGIAWIGGGPGWYHRQRFPEGTFDWKYVESLWTSGASADDYQLIICTESPTEAIWIDDVKFEPISIDRAKHDAAMGTFDEAIATQLKHLAAVKSKIALLPGAEQEPTLHLGVHVARRFLDRVTSLPPSQSMVWSTMQLEEIDSVLNETDRLVERFHAQHPAPRPLRFPLGGPVTIRDGLLNTDTSAGTDKPWFFYGMGHFGSVMTDLPTWREMGATLVQDGRFGPSSMNKDGTLSEGARVLLADLDRADMYGVKTDVLVSPHYFPAWAYDASNSAGLHEGGGLGFLNFNIDHPAAKDAIGRWCDLVSAAMKDKSALLSICLSNEPVYNKSGMTHETLPLYRRYLMDVHGSDIAKLNALYGTRYKSFDEVTPPGHGLVAEVEKNRAYYDWTRFNKKHFADWHRWMAQIVKKNLPNVPVHAKIMVFYSMDRDKLSYGVDPEEFCDFSDIAGCDAYALPTGDYKTYDWFGHEFWYDLLNSFHNQPVFNSENHIFADGTGPVHIPAAMTRAQFWQDALHHQGATTTWVWEKAVDTSLIGDIYYRPANTYGAGRAFIDINRFADEVAAINNAPARFALLYSQPSIFWEEKYAVAIRNIYTRLNFFGEKATFVSEKMLQQRRLPTSAQWIVLPQATHVEDATVAALAEFVAGGGAILRIGAGNLEYDQYHRKREVPASLLDGLAFAKIDFQKDANASQQALRAIFKPAELLDTATRKPVWDVEYRLVEYKGGTLLPMIDFAAGPVVVSCPKIAGKSTIDLLSGVVVDPATIKLEPMVPRLLYAK